MAEVVIAVRGGAAAKSRCRGALGTRGCAELVNAMLADMLEALKAAQGVQRVHVITPTAAIADLAAEMGARVIREGRAQGLNEAFHQARREVARHRPEATLVLLPGDLPLLDPVELERTITLHSPEAVVLCPATGDGGTGALVLRADTPFAFAFGPRSFRLHIAAVHSLGLTPRVVNARSLGFDFDSPADIATVLTNRGMGRTAAHLHGLGVTGAAA